MALKRASLDSHDDLFSRKNLPSRISVAPKTGHFSQRDSGNSRNEKVLGVKRAAECTRGMDRFIKSI